MKYLECRYRTVDGDQATCQHVGVPMRVVKLDASLCTHCERQWVDGPPSEPQTLHVMLKRLLGRIDNPSSTTQRRSNCAHLGEVLDRFSGRCPKCWIRQCDVHGICTIETPQPDVVTCAGCRHYVAEDSNSGDADSHQRARRVVLHCDQSPGDVVVMTAMVRELQRQHPGKFLLAARVPDGCVDLFEHNVRLTPLTDDAEGVEHVWCHYPAVNRSNSRPMHFIDGMLEYVSEKLGLPTMRASRFAGEVFLSSDERSAPNPVSKPYWLLNAGGKQDYTAKIWPAKHAQELVDLLKDRVTFVQVGESHHLHPKLSGVVDMVGKTTMRELVRLVHHSEGIVTGVSLLMHLAAAVPRPGDMVGAPPKRLRPCVVIAGGREPAHWEQYPGHQFLHTIGQLDCCAAGACWKSRAVPTGDGEEHDKSLCLLPRDGSPECLWSIAPRDVVRAMNIEETEGARGESGSTSFSLASREQGFAFSPTGA